MENDQTPNTTESENTAPPSDHAAQMASDASVDLALAALSNLPDLTREDVPLQDEEDLTQVEDAPNGADIAQPTVSNFAVPPISQLERGQAASVVPALALIGLGAFLTFWLTTSKAELPIDIVGGLALVGVGVSLMAHWVSSGRWSRGNLLVGIVLASVGILLLVL